MFLTEQLDKLSSFDYLETIYASNSPTIINPFRDFKLNTNLKSITNQLSFLYNIPKNGLYFKESDYEIRIEKSYDIYLYEGLYLLIEKLILASNNSCNCTIHAYKNQGIKYIEILFSNSINIQIIGLIQSLQSEIIKSSSIKKNHLTLKFFLDDISRKAILELVIATYFNKITIAEDHRSILLEFNRRIDEKK